MSVYSDWKAAYHLDRIAALREGREANPVHLQVSISDLCNQDCNFCSYRAPQGVSAAGFAVGENHNPKRMIPTTKMLEVIEDCVRLGVKAIEFQGGGEPTVHPDHVLIMRSALKAGMDLAVVTNGVRVSDAFVDLAMAASWVRISLDAGNVDSYTAIRRVDAHHYRKVHENIARLVAQKRSCGSAVVLGLGFVVTSENYREVLRVVAQAADSGVDLIRFTPAIFQGGTALTETERQEVTEQLAAARVHARSDFAIYDQFGPQHAEVSAGRPNYQHCAVQFFTPYLGGDQILYRCCLTTYTDPGRIGSIEHQRLFDLWREQFAQMRQFDARVCPMCKFNDRNRMINYLAERSPEHVNFV